MVHDNVHDVRAMLVPLLHQLLADETRRVPVGHPAEAERRAREALAKVDLAGRYGIQVGVVLVFRTDEPSVGHASARREVEHQLAWVAAVLTELVCVLASAALLLDVAVSSAARRRRAVPPRWVYEYGDAIGGAVRMVRLVVNRTCRILAHGARAVPPPLIAALAVGVQLVERLTTS